MAQIWQWQGDATTGAGLVAFTGSQTVVISGTATAVISGTATVVVSGTATVNFSGSGTVELTGSNAGARETLTIDATVGGIGFTSATISGYTKAFVTVETAQIRFTTDGTAPTTTVGHLANPNDIIKLDTAADLASFRAIRTGATSGSLQCTYSV